MRFVKHGKYKITQDGNILVLNATGPWNEEAARSFETMIKDCVTEWFPGDATWAMLAILNGESIYTVEAAPIIRELHKWRVANGLRCIANVHSPDSSTVRELTMYQFNSFYNTGETDECSAAYFEDEGAARTWLAEQGYTSATHSSPIKTHSETL